MQILETRKGEVNNEFGLPREDRSYKVRLIPGQGKIGRHSDLAKHKFQVDMKGNASLEAFHPITYLNIHNLLVKKVFSESLIMSPSELIKLFDSLEKIFGSEGVQKLDPHRMFGAKFLDRKDIQELNAAFKEFFLNLEASFENRQRLQEVINDISTERQVSRYSYLFHLNFYWYGHQGFKIILGSVLRIKTFKEPSILCIKCTSSKAELDHFYFSQIFFIELSNI